MVVFKGSCDSRRSRGSSRPTRCDATLPSPTLALPFCQRLMHLVAVLQEWRQQQTNAMRNSLAFYEALAGKDSLYTKRCTRPPPLPLLWPPPPPPPPPLLLLLLFPFHTKRGGRALLLCLSLRLCLPLLARCAALFSSLSS